MALLDKILAFAEWLLPGPINRLKINIVVGREKRRRPHPFSLWTGAATGAPSDPLVSPPTASPPPIPAFEPSSYVSWPGLADRTYTGRHLPPDPVWTGALPSLDELFEKLFRRQGEMKPCRATTALFCFFAQWFTDSFLRTQRDDRRRHTGNNEIDFCQIYGLDERATRALRTRKAGLIRTRPSETGERLPFLVVREGAKLGEIHPDFHDLPYLDRNPETGEVGKGYRGAIESSLRPHPFGPERWQNMYATALDRGNSTIFYTALTTMCVREHNRIARELARIHGEWDDDRLFETARLINIHNVLEIVIQDYINHIAGAGTFRLDANFAERQPWYRTNRISIEFNLLYRWHSLVPDSVEVAGRKLAPLDYRFNNLILEESTPEALINAASAAPAGRIGVRNTPDSLKHAEIAAFALAREFRLQPFNAYCERFGQPKYETIEDLAGPDKETAATLNRLYGGHVDKVEFLVGLYAERRSAGAPDSVLPPTLRTMVAVDAFTHILTNPVLSGQVREEVFRDDIKHLIADTGQIGGLMARNSQGPVKAMPRFSLLG